MTEVTFARRSVERSFRKFTDIINDLLQADFRTWGNSFTHLVTHCENDPIMKVVIGPLKDTNLADAHAWYEQFARSVGGMAGSGRYELPYDDDERTALLYQFFLMIENGEVAFDRFCIDAYGKTHFQEMVWTFNRELVEKFAREVSYRLKEILEDTAEESLISSGAMILFQHFDQSTNIEGNVVGSVVAAGDSRISNADISYSSYQEVGSALEGLVPLVEEVSEEFQSTVRESLEGLILMAREGTPSRNQVEEFATVIRDQAPGIAAALKSIALSMVGSLAASGLFHGLMAVLG